MNYDKIETLTMEPREALKKLKAYQDWRLGKIDECPLTPKEVSQILDIAISRMQHYEFVDFSINEPLMKQINAQVQTLHNVLPHYGVKTFNEKTNFILDFINEFKKQLLNMQKDESS